MLHYEHEENILRVESTGTLSLSAGEMIAFDLKSGGKWYGHGFNHDQPYPLNTGRIENPQFCVNNIQSPIWFCSNGWAILADTTEVLVVSINANGDGQLRIQPTTHNLILRLFKGDTLPEAHAQLMRRR